MPGLEISVVFISDSASGKQPQRNYEIQLECNNITYTQSISERTALNEQKLTLV